MAWQESEEEAARLEREREDMEATLHEVASDLGRLALLYRTQGKAPHAVPLYMTALAIYEKTLVPHTEATQQEPSRASTGALTSPHEPSRALMSPHEAGDGRRGIGMAIVAPMMAMMTLDAPLTLQGPDHPEVAKDLVNLGNAFCDQNQHAEAVPLYLRALAIDQAALGDDHPEVAMDLSNLGIVYRVQGRRDEAIALFQRAHSIMSGAGRRLSSYEEPRGATRSA